MRLKALIVGLAFVLAAGPGQAATLFSVDGVESGFTPLGSGSPHGGVAQVFEVAEPLTNVGFSFEMTCYDCTGGLWLITGEMSENALGRHVVSSRTFEDLNGAQSALSDLTLSPGIYTLIMTMTDGQGGWQALTAPSITGNVITPQSGYLEFVGDADPNFVPWSNTAAVSGKMLKFTVTGYVAAAPVPLPASLPLLLVALAGLGLIRRRGRG